jgi:hypothetical protein
MPSYIGYIVKEGETNPFSVFIPALCGMGTPFFNTSDGFGSNMGKWDINTLHQMQGSAIKCYQTSSLSAANTYDFDTSNGYATVERNLGELTGETAKDVSTGKVAPLATSCPSKDEPFDLPNDNPAFNCVRNYRFSSALGTQFPSLLNAPEGNYTSLSPSTRVLVDYPGNGNIGYIIAQLPGADTLSTMIKNNMKEK